MSSLAAVRALGVDLRHSDTGTLLGVALLVPSQRQAAILIEGTTQAIEPQLTPTVWQAIDAWIETGDAGLPFRPAPLGATVVEALLDRAPAAIRAQRFASFDVRINEAAAVVPPLDRFLPALLDTRRLPD